jgi:hypothetical protein
MFFFLSFVLSFLVFCLLLSLLFCLLLSFVWSCLFFALPCVFLSSLVLSCLFLSSLVFAFSRLLFSSLILSSLEIFWFLRADVFANHVSPHDINYIIISLSFASRRLLRKMRCPASQPIKQSRSKVQIFISSRLMR